MTIKRPTHDDINLRDYLLPNGPKLNLGCGPVQPTDWINVDGSNRAWLAGKLWYLDRTLVKLGVLAETEFGPHVRIHNLFKPLPYASNTVACIYAGELWEHFEYPDGKRLAKECLRVLAPGGVLRVCVPDGPAFWQEYLALYQKQYDLAPEKRSLETLHAHVELFFEEIATRKKWLGSMGHTHKWQYDEVQLIDQITDVGFQQVGRMQFHHSRIPDVSSIERSDFCIVEGVKSVK